MSNKGRVIAVIGNMYAGKSTMLLYHLRRAEIANKRVKLFKPKIDTRYSVTSVVSHDGEEFPATPIETYKEAYEDSYGFDVIGFDEVQFFEPDILDLINKLASEGKVVIVAGLNVDFMGNPFETTSRVAMVADKIEKLDAVCVLCGEDATWTQMVVDGVAVTSGDRVQVGGSELYEPRCRGCFVR